MKVRTVEVGPSSFQKIKLLGKGDVGKVYLVREKKTERLYAMKGARDDACARADWEVLSKREMIKRNKIKRALAEQVRPRSELTSLTGPGNPRNVESPVHRHASPLVPVGRLPLLLHGVLHVRDALA